MAEKKLDYMNIPAEKFEFVNHGERISDKAFEDKPIGYFKDAWIRFCKNKASVVALVIIVFVVLYAFLMPIFNTTVDPTFLASYYDRMAPRHTALREYGIMDGGVNRNFSEVSLLTKVGIGVGAADYEGKGDKSVKDGLESEYQPMLNVGNVIEKATGRRNKGKEIIDRTYPGRIDTYLELGFMYQSIQQSELKNIQAWEEETGLKVLYPLVEANEYNPAVGTTEEANIWYKANKSYVPMITGDNGKVKALESPFYSADLVIEDNYKRDGEGNPIYWEYTGGGSHETAQLKIRVLYYNYYYYQNGHEPNYLFGTDSQGYDLSLRMADGIKLSLLVAVCVSVINFIIGAMWGAVSGYYGGTTDIVMQRITDILGGVPFMVVATLFQIHLATKVGAIPSLLFAFVVTGWLGTAARVRTQFYRFKNQEYIMAARTLGARDRRIIWKHIFPNSLGTLITSSALVIPGVINQESMLSYLGIVKLGTSDATSLGTLLSDASKIWTDHPHLMIFPALVLSLLMICFNLFGNGLRDAFNPSLRGVEE
ncbi:MAG: ABC transporter permease subunit [Clostridia bacterium]|nr:ABC transporter permease subunit [Clostridia bacterium]